MPDMPTPSASPSTGQSPISSTPKPTASPGRPTIPRRTTAAEPPTSPHTPNAVLQSMQYRLRTDRGRSGDEHLGVGLRHPVDQVIGVGRHGEEFDKSLPQRRGAEYLHGLVEVVIGTTLHRRQ